jgi:hypothetical protein
VTTSSILHDYTTFPAYARLKRLGYNDQEIVLAYTAYGEARSEGRLGMQAVIDVITNRAALGANDIVTWWGKSPLEVALKETRSGKTWMFDCWRPGTKNYHAMYNANPDQLKPALSISRAVLAGQLEDITNGADHYLNPTPDLYKNGVLPGWYSNNLEAHTVSIGNHVFLGITKYDSGHSPENYRKTGWINANNLEDGEPGIVASIKGKFWEAADYIRGGIDSGVTGIFRAITGKRPHWFGEITIQPGDTLAKLTHEFHPHLKGDDLTFMAVWIARQNGIANPDRIVAGHPIDMTP